MAENTGAPKRGEMTFSDWFFGMPENPAYAAAQAAPQTARPASQGGPTISDWFFGRPPAPAAPTTSLRPQARPEQITADQVRQLFGSSPLEMGRPARGQQAEPTVSGAALRLLGPGLQQMISGAQSQELERMRQAAPASPLTGRDMVADLTARAAEQMLQNELADLGDQYPAGVPRAERNAAYQRYVDTLTGNETLRSLMMRQAEE